MEICLLCDLAALVGLMPEWQALAARSLEPNPFYEDWMVLPALEAFGDGGIAFAAVRSRGELVGLFPLERRARYRGLPARTLASWRHRHCLLSVPLVREDCAPQCLRAFLRAMHKHASVVEFAHLPADGPFQHALVDALKETAVAWAPTDTYTRPLMRRGADAEAYAAAALSGEMRGELRRKARRLGELGRVTHRVLRPGDDVARWIDEFMALEAAGWKGRKGSALACSAENRRFGAAILAGGFARGRLVMVGIDLDGHPVARYAAFTAGPGAFAFKTAYDERLRRVAPGLLAELDMLRALHAAPGVQWADSYTGPGNTTIGRFWTSRRAIQRLALGLDAWGELALAVQPLARWARRRVRNMACKARSAGAMLARWSGTARPPSWSRPGSPLPRP